ncbi:hypothetical protein DV532_28230 (plasmid) [Pseudomonas sp. Leaf58]|uniref:hypothetical protein n=1 Tax=unclassified Pseudomonas TaxID=196821 RepID=UPI0006F9CF76|nr:hypothetical protein [Pseudomonas sp. Leaf58]AYG48158.1 hypothetical protein DV532_28230 [Pseudomonas sp. Leaf58]KQN62290.1 hypothetical protein ASF02_08995 [Pseudomonas sp. Leaf58]
MAITLDNPNSMDGLQSRLESCIGKIKGHIELSNTPELFGLVGKGEVDQISISMDMANGIVSLLADCMLGFSALELDAAQGSYAAEESHLLRERVRALTKSQQGLIKLLQAVKHPEHARAIREAETLLNETGGQL